ncbi:MAG: D-hexose-6-phosphate mutarotase [Pontibacterium sp.]
MSVSSLENILKQSHSLTLTHSSKYYQSTSPGLPLLRVSNAFCDAVISLQGAQLLEFKARRGPPLLWLSPQAVFEPEQAIRGGIPVCLPWFGVNTSDKGKPKHGFVRNQTWELEHVEEPDDDSTQLTFVYRSSEQDQLLFPHAFSARLRMVLADTLHLQLSITNHSELAAPFSWALHSYHAINTLKDVRVTGLEGLTYLDNCQGLTPVLQQGPVSFGTEVDRVYESVPDIQTIEGNPGIQIKGQDCDTAIVWNPGPALAASMSDVGPDNHQGFVCVERGAAFANSWTLAPDETRTGKLWISAIHRKNGS